LHTTDAASSPEHITSRWRVWDGKTWVDVDDVKVSAVGSNEVLQLATDLSSTEGGGALDVCAFLVSVEAVPDARKILPTLVQDDLGSMVKLLDTEIVEDHTDFKGAGADRKEAKLIFAALQAERGRQRKRSVIVRGIHSSDRTRTAKSTADKYTVHELVAGKPVEAAHGIAHLMGLTDSEAGKKLGGGLDAIRAEFESPGVSEEDRANMRYVLDQMAVEQELDSNDGTTMIVRDMGNAGKNLAAFGNHPNAVKAKLDLAHIAALRIYTSSSFKQINDPLRKRQQPHPFAATTLFIDKALRKLRALNDGGGSISSPSTCDDEQQHYESVFWRGMKNLTLTDSFLANGGTEFGFMSTSISQEIVGMYARSEHPLVFRLVASDFMACGANIAWLSMFPQEAEVLFPPLTYLKPVPGSKRKIHGTDGFRIDVEPRL
jgi:hypothetical protein